MIPHMTTFPSCVIRTFRNPKGLDKDLLDQAPGHSVAFCIGLSFKTIPHINSLLSCVIRTFRTLKGLDKDLLDQAPDHTIAFSMTSASK